MAPGNFHSPSRSALDFPISPELCAQVRLLGFFFCGMIFRSRVSRVYGPVSIPVPIGPLGAPEQGGAILAAA